MTPLLGFLIVVFFLGIALNALFAGYETGFLSVDSIRLRHRSEEEQDPAAQYLLQARQRPDHMLTTVLVGTNISLIAGTYAITNAVGLPWLATLIATPAFLLFAEVIPKSIFLRYPNRLSLRLLPVIRFFDLLLLPIIMPTVWTLKGFRRMLGVQDDQANPLLSTEDDLRNLIDESASRGSIAPDEQQMIHSIMDLEETQAKAVMVPRIQVTAVPINMTREELTRVFEESGLTRLPVYEDSIDSIIGVVYVYDLLMTNDAATPEIAPLVRDILHVHDTKPIDQLLQEMKQSRQHIAIVTDEHGGTFGLVTIEDIVEEIFGEIHDEHDPRDNPIVQVGPRAFVVDASVTLEDLRDVMPVAPLDSEVETVAGWVMRAARRIPLQGEKIKYEGFRVTVLEGTRNRIEKVRIDILSEPESWPEPYQQN